MDRLEEIDKELSKLRIKAQGIQQRDLFKETNQSNMFGSELPAIRARVNLLIEEKELLDEQAHNSR